MSGKCNEIHLFIANIHFIITAEEGINLFLAPRHLAFRLDEQHLNYNWKDVVRIRFCHKLPDPITSPVRVWDVSDSSPSWKVFDYHNESRIFLYDQDGEKPLIMSMKPHRSNQTIMVSATDSEHVEVLKYPMDIILMYYLSLNYSILIVHASGFLLDNNGHICLGRSGAGKTTLYNLATQAGGAKVQDDRLILRQTRNGWFMYPLPLSHNDRPIEVKIHRLNALIHGPRNLAIPLTGTVRINQFLPHIVQFPNWNHHYGYQLNLVGDLLRTVRIFQLFFTPDLTAIQYLQNGRDAGKYNYIPPEKPMPSTIKGFRQKHDPLNIPR